MSDKKEISFLPPEDDVNSNSARAIRWVTTVGRFIIVFSELVVICAFISRFWLDRMNSDLSESVRQQKAILETTVDFEKQYSLLQQRLKFIGAFYNSQPDYKSKIDALVKSTPPEIMYSNLTIARDPDSPEISGKVSLYTYQESSIVDYITNLTLNPKIKTVNITRIERKPNEEKYFVDLVLAFAKDK